MKYYLERLFKKRTQLKEFTSLVFDICHFFQSIKGGAKYTLFLLLRISLDDLCYAVNLELSNNVGRFCWLIAYSIHLNHENAGITIYWWRGFRLVIFIESSACN